MRMVSMDRVECSCPDRYVDRVRAVWYEDGTAVAVRHGPGTDCRRAGERDAYAVAMSFKGLDADAARRWCAMVCKTDASEWTPGRWEDPR